MPILLRLPLGSGTANHAQVVTPALQLEASGHDGPKPTDPIQRIKRKQQRDRVLQRSADGLKLPGQQGDHGVVLLGHVPGAVPENHQEHGAHAHQADCADQGRTQGGPPLHGDPQGHRDLVRAHARLLVILAWLRREVAQVQLEWSGGAFRQSLARRALQALSEDLERALRCKEVLVLPLDEAHAVVLGDLTHKPRLADAVACDETDGFRRLLHDFVQRQVRGLEHRPPRVHHEPSDEASEREPRAIDPPPHLGLGALRAAVQHGAVVRPSDPLGAVLGIRRPVAIAEAGLAIGLTPTARGALRTIAILDLRALLAVDREADRVARCGATVSLQGRRAPGSEICAECARERRRDGQQG
mmetsp:Transcript_105277/g.304537  ORF Transcript_105277/g.304537 Transcript_105277/m.304537 type:complete len:358 (+) Transcript_105277:511-1584(+)